MSNFTSPWTEPKRLVSLSMTCRACPSQWEGEFEDGTWMYGRYRHGHLIISVGPTADEAVMGSFVFGASIAGAYDGEMTTEEMLHYARNVVQGPFPPAVAQVDPDAKWD